MRKTLLWTCVFSLALVIPCLASQSTDEQQPSPQTAPVLHPGSDPATRSAPLSQQVVKTFYLANVTEPARLQDVVNGMRNILEFARVQPIPAIHAIVVRGNPEQIAAAEKLVRDIDQPRGDVGGASYRLEFALHDVENGKRVGTRNYSMMVQRGATNHEAEWAHYRVGSKVPVMSGTSSAQVQYMDIGVNIDCRMWGADPALLLENTVELSSLATPSNADSGHPIVRQMKAASFATVAAGKPTVIGSLDSVDSTRRTEIEVTATRVK
jgi:type II secretory pathway component GspD/PulD (secretin)